MLSQRFDSLKSQTIPSMEGQDESFAMEIPYDLLTMTNSCPDLSLITTIGGVEPARPTDTDNSPAGKSSNVGSESAGLEAAVTPSKVPLGYRRSTSLNSLEAENYSRDSGSAVDGNVQGANVAKAVVLLENALQTDLQQRRIPHGDFSRSTTRSSYTGPGFFHKSVSSPSMQSISPPVQNVGPKLLQLSQTKSEDSAPTTKRSFFRRKQKRKRPPHPKAQPYCGDRDKMNGVGDSYQETLGTMALSDAYLGLKEADVECWAKFMKPEVVASLTDKEVKRQEHMYEIILTEKHHCLTLALMHHMFLADMKNSGYTREARLLFPGLTDLLQVHLEFFRRLKEKQLEFWAKDEPLDNLADRLVEQFSGDQWLQMIRLYGLLCSSLEKSFETFKVMKQKDQKFAALVAGWNKESLLGRKNVTECLLLVAQRITKYPLLIEPLIKTCACPVEKEELGKAWTSSKELNSRVNERVAERERMFEACSKIDSKSLIHDGQRRIRAAELLSLPNRRLVFSGLAVVSRIVNGNSTFVGVCNVMVLTDSIICTQDIGGKVTFVSPPGLVMLNNIIVRENAGHELSMYLVMGTGSKNPEMIELQVRNPANRQQWQNAFKEAQTLFEEELDLFSDFDEDVNESMEGLEHKALKGLDELQEHDKKLLQLLKTRTKLVESLRSDKPYNWTLHSFEGKDTVLAALSEAAAEIQKSLQNMDVNSNTVNRSASCVSAHVTSIMGLPRRADTFGGFDSQQRTLGDSSSNSKMLSQVVLQLSELCGELFSQMVPNLSLNISQNNGHLQRRMEDLREAQQRFEADKAQWQQSLYNQKQELDRERLELNSMKDALQRQDIDISQQREQLYRKLEKLESQGMKPLLDSVTVSPISVATNFDKSTVGITARRSPSQLTQSNIPINIPGNPVGSKQQLPLHLASLARSNTTSSLISTDKHYAKTTVIPPTKGSPTGSITSPVQSSDIRTPVGRPTSAARLSSAGLSASSIQQMLPLRLSEGLGQKASSLPRGVGPKTVGDMKPTGAHTDISNGNPMPRSIRPNSHVLHHSKSSTSIPTSNTGYSTTSYATDRMSNYYRALHTEIGRDPLKFHGFGDDKDINGVGVVHRRSGSSPVPMSTSNVPYNRQNQVRKPYTSSQSNEDEDSSKILYL